MICEKRRMLRCWLEAIINHSRTLGVRAQHHFIIRELEKLTKDFDPKWIEEDWDLVSCPRPRAPKTPALFDWLEEPTH